jgi:hypothetical protein
MHWLMQSQQACSISQQALSPLVQVMQQPSLVISHLHWHIAMLHWHMTMPFIMQQQLHMPLDSILQRFCSMPQDISSSHTQVIFMPLAHFSIFILQRGSMVMPPIGAGIEGMLGIELGMLPIMDRSIIIVVFIKHSFGTWSHVSQLVAA